MTKGRRRRLSIREMLQVKRGPRPVIVPYPEDVIRPATRGDCVDGDRPCPFVSCRYHTMLDIDPDTGSITFNRDDIGDLSDSCALDVADRGGAILEEIGELLQVTRERIRQIERRALIKYRALSRREGIDERALPFPEAGTNYPETP